jgi:5,10-methylenetetrahydromethanopterin reductase
MSKHISIAFQSDKTAASYVALAKLVNQFAFDVVSVYCDAPYHPSYGPLLLMAPHIHRARLGPAAVSPFRIHPIDIAASTALLTDLAGGRGYIGLARGAWLEEHGIQEADRPLTAIREAVAIIRMLLSGSSGGYQGRIFQIAPHVHAPYPLPDAPLPLMIGTWGQKLAGIAGEIADELKVGGSSNPDLVPVVRSWIARGESQAGREPGSVKLVIGSVTVVDPDRQLARELAREKVALYLPVVAPLDPTLQVEPGLLVRLRSAGQQGDWRSAGRLISDDLLDRFCIAGDAGDIVRQVEELYDSGVDRVEFGTPHGVDQAAGISILGSKVIPAL